MHRTQPKLIYVYRLCMYILYMHSSYSAHVCIIVYMYGYAYIYVYIYIFMFTCKYTKGILYTYVNKYNLHICRYVCVCMYKYVCICVCLYIGMYVCCRDVNKDLTPKDQDKDKDLTP